MGIHRDKEYARGLAAFERAGLKERREEIAKPMHVREEMDSNGGRYGPAAVLTHAIGRLLIEQDAAVVRSDPR